MSASNRRDVEAANAAPRALAPLFRRYASACVNGVAGLLGGIPSEIVKGLASHHLSNHAYRFVLTERDAILVGRGRDGQNIVQAGRANAQRPGKQG